MQETLTKSMSKKIMDTAKEQMEEMEAEEMGRCGLPPSLRRRLILSSRRRSCCRCAFVTMCFAGVAIRTATRAWQSGGSRAGV